VTQSNAAGPRLRLKSAAIGSVLLGLGLVGSTSFLVQGPIAGATGHKRVQSTCSAYKPGRKGVIRTFCSGQATATVTSAGTTTVIKGGTCGRSGMYFTVNVGVVVSPSYKGPKPNYFGLDVPPTATSFTNAVLSYATRGVGGYATSNSGTVASNHKSGTFSGTDLEGKTVSGSFTC
jgi:hypothetical protein